MTPPTALRAVTETGTIKLLYFAWLRERTGTAEEILPLPTGVQSVGALIDWLVTRTHGHAAAFASRKTVRCAVNQDFADPETPVRPGDEVAFFPLLLGVDLTTIRVQQADIDIGAEFAALGTGRADIGGLGCFVGTVRDTAKGRKILSMTLEHYPAMTEPAMARIAAEAENRWPLLGCTLIHRVGTLLPGENIVLVLTASAHRRAALDATGFLIDWLKTRAPFWKKERFADGDENWVQPNEADDTAAARWTT